MARQPQGRAGVAGEAAGGSGPLPVWMKVFLTVSLAPLIAVLFPTFMLVGLGMLPTVAVYLADRSRGKSFAICVALTNLCGVLPSLARLWDRGQTMQAATAIAGDPLFWMMPMGAAGLGWLIFMCVPPVIAAYYQSAGAARIQHLLAKQQDLKETWGEDILGDDPQESGQDADSGAPGSAD